MIHDLRSRLSPPSFVTQLAVGRRSTEKPERFFLNARPVFLKLAAFFFAFAAACALVAAVAALRPARTALLYMPAPPREFRLAEDLGMEVGLVTLDRETSRSYARLKLWLPSPHQAPQRLWVRTYFFTPGDPAGRVWAGEAVELKQPFVEYNYAHLTVAAPCTWCADEDAPPSGYFARVQSSTDGRTPRCRLARIRRSDNCHARRRPRRDGQRPRAADLVPLNARRKILFRPSCKFLRRAH